MAIKIRLYKYNVILYNFFKYNILLHNYSVTMTNIYLTFATQNCFKIFTNI